MGFLKDFRRTLVLVRLSQTAYGQAMKIVEEYNRLKQRIKIIEAIVITWAIVVLLLLIYIAAAVS